MRWGVRRTLAAFAVGSIFLQAGCAERASERVRRVRTAVEHALDDLRAGEPVEQCRLLLTPIDHPIPAGYAVEVTLTLKNEGATDINVGEMGWVGYKVKLLYEDEPVPLTRYGRHHLSKPESGSARIRPIAPGSEMKETVLTNLLFDMSEPGRYTLLVSRDLRNRAGTGSMELVSNRISIDVD